MIEEGQHDDHCWLTMGGRNFKILERHGDVFLLWRGWWPRIEAATVRMTKPGWEKPYARAAARMLKKAAQQ